MTTHATATLKATMVVVVAARGVFVPTTPTFNNKFSVKKQHFFLYFHFPAPFFRNPRTNSTLISKSVICKNFILFAFKLKLKLKFKINILFIIKNNLRIIYLIYIRRQKCLNLIFHAT